MKTCLGFFIIAVIFAVLSLFVAIPVYTYVSYKRMWANANPAGTKYVVRYRDYNDTLSYPVRSVLLGNNQQNIIYLEDTKQFNHFTTTAEISIVKEK